MRDGLYHAQIISKISGALWIRQLSMMITEFGCGNVDIQSRSSKMKDINKGVSKDPLTMLQCIIPFKERAGSIEYLKQHVRQINYQVNITYRLPRMK